MTRFYALWDPKDGKKGLTAAAALKEAQAYVRTYEPLGSDARESGVRGPVRRGKKAVGKRPWEHPYYWAAWVLWGRP